LSSFSSVRSVVRALSRRADKNDRSYMVVRATI
jgi:hypothetical protein